MAKHTLVVIHHRCNGEKYIAWWQSLAMTTFVAIILIIPETLNQSWQNWKRIGLFSQVCHGCNWRWDWGLLVSGLSLTLYWYFYQLLIKISNLRQYVFDQKNQLFLKRISNLKYENKSFRKKTNLMKKSNLTKMSNLVKMSNLRQKIKVEKNLKFEKNVNF